ncbi:MAG TPA: hypothetical protein VN950_11550 [Terriglobales bacterium]|nr:hypothetical protein [Terriglobales bacterium]
MAPQRTIVRRLKSIFGAVLVGLGMFILYADTVGAVAHLRDVLGNGSAAVGGLPAAILVFAQIVHVHALEHQRFVQGLFQRVLLSSLWPLFLVIFGTVLSRDTFADSEGHFENADSEAIDVSRSHAKHN